MNLSCTLHLKIILLLATRCQLPGVNLKVPMAINLNVTLAVNSGSKLEGALPLGTRCHCMNTSSKNMKSFWVWTLDVTCLGAKLEGDSGSKLEGDSGSGSKLEGDSGSKLEGDSGSGSKLEGKSGSKLEGALLLVDVQ